VIDSYATKENILGIEEDRFFEYLCFSNI